MKDLGVGFNKLEDGTLNYQQQQQKDHVDSPLASPTLGGAPSADPKTTEQQ